MFQEKEKGKRGKGEKEGKKERKEGRKKEKERKNQLCLFPMRVFDEVRD